MNFDQEVAKLKQDWVENARCTTYGCKEVASLRLQRLLPRREPELYPLDIRLQPPRPVQQGFRAAYDPAAIRALAEAIPVEGQPGRAGAGAAGLGAAFAPADEGTRGPVRSPGPRR